MSKSRLLDIPGKTFLSGNMQGLHCKYSLANFWAADLDQSVSVLNSLPLKLDFRTVRVQRIAIFFKFAVRYIICIEFLHKIFTLHFLHNVILHD